MILIFFLVNAKASANLDYSRKIVEILDKVDGGERCFCCDLLWLAEVFLLVKISCNCTVLVQAFDADVAVALVLIIYKYVIVLMLVVLRQLIMH